MWLKIIILVLFFLMLLSLTGAFVFLMKDMAQGKRTVYLLGARVSIAALMMFCVWYGYDSGILTGNAPWNR
ncbi:MAG: DUF2909 domain-containing protein [Cellvibrionaceae bacterium]